jgi:hypothetical protein
MSRLVSEYESQSQGIKPQSLWPKQRKIVIAYNVRQKDQCLEKAEATVAPLLPNESEYPNIVTVNSLDD